ncbi:MAG: response regulator, partial [Nitrososphaeraceae archaeon]
MSIDQSIHTSSQADNDNLFAEEMRRDDVTKVGHSHKILVVDDEQDVVFTLKTILTEAGFSVDAFTNPSIAFEMFRPEKYELIILDIR